MIRKLLTTAVLAGMAVSPAFALVDAGFESGTTNDWGFATNGTLTAVQSNTAPMTVWNDYTDGSGNKLPDFVTPYNINAASGNYFGVFTADFTSGPLTSSVLNLTGPASRAGDLLQLRLFSGEYDFPAHNDYAFVQYFGNGGLLASDKLDVATGIAPGAIDSGWKGYAVPFGTTSIAVSLYNVSPDGNEPPILGLDYTAAPVPEADTAAMMLAGLGALGFVARRRRTMR